jgi:hypothetical protein
MNTKDRERFGIMESQLRDLRDDVKDIHKKIDLFIDCADKKYATKEHVCSLEKDIKNRFNERNQWVRWLPSVLSSVVAALALLKSFGVF